MFKCSLRKHTHLLGSLSPLTFKVARFRAIKPTNQCSTRNLCLQFGSCRIPRAAIASQGHRKILPRCLSRLPLFTSWTEKEEENPDPENARQACITRVLHLHAPPARFPLSINTMSDEFKQFLPKRRLAVSRTTLNNPQANRKWERSNGIKWKTTGDSRKSQESDL